jgi:class I fructose-bisphosphate aldolase
MGIGKRIRLNRIFSHPSGRLCSVAVDHFLGYQNGLPQGLTDLSQTLKEVMAGRPDAVTMLKGTAIGCWQPHAGRAPLILQAVAYNPDETVIEVLTGAEEAIRLGADALAVAIGVRGPNEGKFLKILSDKVDEAARYDLPIISHIYPRDFSDSPTIVHDPENIAWAIRCGIECGADVIKVPYTGDVESYAQLVRSCPVPVVAAGGPKSETLEQALTMMAEVVASGALGGTIGRNIWGAKHITGALLAFKAVIHEGKTPQQALEASTKRKE